MTERTEIKRSRREEVLQKNSCSVAFIVVVLLLIFLLIVAGLYLTSRKTKSLNFSGINFTNEKEKSISDNIEKVSPGNEVIIEINENDINEKLDQVTDFPLKNPKASITPTNIIIKGKSSSNIFSLSVDVYLVPEAKEGVIGLTVSEIRTGKVIAPKQISDRINQSLGNNMSQLIPLSDQIIVNKINQFDHHLLIYGTKK